MFPREADGHQAGQDVPHLLSDHSVPHSQQPVPLSNLDSVIFFLSYVSPVHSIFMRAYACQSLSVKCFDKFLYDFPMYANKAHSIPLLSALDDEYKRLYFLYFDVFNPD
jgi:hypothetical protein